MFRKFLSSHKTRWNLSFYCHRGRSVSRSHLSLRRKHRSHSVPGMLSGQACRYFKGPDLMTFFGRFQLFASQGKPLAFSMFLQWYGWGPFLCRAVWWKGIIPRTGCSCFARVVWPGIEEWSAWMRRFSAGWHQWREELVDRTPQSLSFGSWCCHTLGWSYQHPPGVGSGITCTCNHLTLC